MVASIPRIYQSRYSNSFYNVKVELSLCITNHHAKTYWGSGGIAPRSLLYRNLWPDFVASFFCNCKKTFQKCHVHVMRQEIETRKAQDLVYTTDRYVLKRNELVQSIQCEGEEVSICNYVSLFCLDRLVM
jgi:hypothetical protein